MKASPIITHDALSFVQIHRCPATTSRLPPNFHPCCYGGVGVVVLREGASALAAAFTDDVVLPLTSLRVFVPTHADFVFFEGRIAPKHFFWVAIIKVAQIGRSATTASRQVAPHPESNQKQSSCF